jgi:hypothetical protein
VTGHDLRVMGERGLNVNPYWSMVMHGAYDDFRQQGFERAELSLAVRGGGMGVRCGCD